MRATRIPNTLQRAWVLLLPIAVVAGIWAAVKAYKENRCKQPHV